MRIILISSVIEYIMYDTLSRMVAMTKREAFITLISVIKASLFV